MNGYNTGISFNKFNEKWNLTWRQIYIVLPGNTFVIASKTEWRDGTLFQLILSGFCI